MDKMRRLLSSPLSRRRQAPSPPAPPRYLGASLEELVQREGSIVPLLISRCCTYIYQNGLDYEGVFRINGNSKVIEKLRQTYDKSGDANLNDVADVMAVASLIKLFLREMPEGVIPERYTGLMAHRQQEYAKDSARCMSELKVVIDNLPRPNYALLKYLSRFLVVISQREKVNKMSPMALGIVFGPNLFRCTSGFKEQAITNHIVLKFITDYDSMFLADNEISPYSQNFKFMKSASGGMHQETSNETDTSNLSPRKHTDDDEVIDTARSMSPFALEAETPRSECSNALYPGAHNEDVEKAISSVVTEHLFGPNMPTRNGASAPVPAPRTKATHEFNSDDSENDSSDSEAVGVSVKQRITQLQTSDGTTGTENSEAPRKRRPRSQAFEMFESTGIIIGMGGEQKDKDDGSEHRPVPKPRSSPKMTRDSSSSTGSPAESVPTSSQDSVHTPQDSDDSGFGTIQRTSDTLIGFKRAPGPKNRRNPSRQSLKRNSTSPEDQQLGNLQYIAEDDGEKTDLNNHQDFENNEDEQEEEEDVNHNPTKPSVKFLELHHNGNTNNSPERSPPQGSRKPYIPPLDLSILHEHGDGNEPIPAAQGPTLQSAGHDNVMVSPRLAQFKPNNTVAPPDTDIPPSPPTDQHGPRLISSATREDNLVKQLTKKIQLYKRKIKAFEESFERDNGYRPSQTDKAAQPEIKRYMQDLARTRKELKRVKADCEPLAVTSTMPASDAGPPPMGDTLRTLLTRLEEKSRDAGRPSDVSMMTLDQIQDEKLAVQKALLHFEGLHGRPQNKVEKEMMRPLYNRYRTIKRTLNKSTPTSAGSTDSMNELQPVPEHHTIEFPASREGQTKSGFDDEDDFRVTHDFGHLLRERDSGGGSSSTIGPITEAEEDEEEEDRDTGGGDGSVTEDDKPHSNLHELTLPQLQYELQRARSDKKRLRRLLRDFEDLFQKQTGHKVQKEDRRPKEAEYHEYKQVKARLKLLDALISKHDPCLAAM